MPNPLLIDYLERCRATYRLQYHLHFDAVAGGTRCHCPDDATVAKASIVRADNELCMVIAPDHCDCNAADLASSVGAKRVVRAAPQQFANRFPRCDVGAIPPFGHLFGLRALLLPWFDEQSDVLFSAGSALEMIRMHYSEFDRLAHADRVALPWQSVPRGYAVSRRRPSLSPAGA